MTSPFVDRVEYQVIGRDTNASRVFRDVADAADAAGDSIGGLGTDLDRVNRSIDDTADRMRALLSSLQDLSATREITITTNVREVLGSIEDNRQVIDLLDDRFENLTVNVTATVNQLIELNDGLITIDDNRTAVIDLGDDVLQLTQNVTATVDSVVELNDGLQTIDDNRAVVIDLGDDVRQLTQNITATVDSVVELNDGIQTIDDNRTAVITLGDDVLQLTQNIDATVDSVVELNDGIQTIDDNRAAVVTLADDVLTLTQNIDATVDSVVELNDGIQTIDDNRAVIVTVDDDFRTLTQSVDATVDSVVSLNDGIQTIDDNRAVIVTVDDDFRTLTQDIDATVNSIVNLNDGITTVDDNRTAITGVGDDFRNLGDDIDNTRTVVIRFNDEVARVDDNRAGVADLGTGFDDLSTAVERSRGRVVDLDRDIRNLPAGRDIDNDIDVTRRVVETVSSNRDRLERAGIVAGAAVGAGMVYTIGQVLTNGIAGIPLVGPMSAAFIKAISQTSTLIVAALAIPFALAATSIAIIAANAFTAGILGALGGGVILAGLLAALADPNLKIEIKSLGESIKVVLVGAVKDSGFAKTMGEAIAYIRGEFTKLRPAITDLFRAAGPLIKPLAEGVMGFAREVLPGLTDALRNSKPIFEELAKWLPHLGKTIGDFFRRISFVAPEAARALGLMMGALDTAITAIGFLLEGLGKLQGPAEFVLKWLGKITSWAGVGPGWIGFWSYMWDGPSKIKNVSSSVEGLGGALAKAREFVAGTKTEMEKLADATRKALDAANGFINVGDSQLAMYESMEAATKRVAEASGKDLKKGIDLSTAAGKENWKTLAAIGRNANRAASDVLAMNGTQEDAAAVTAIARQKFMETAAAMGITGQAAEDLANMMFGIPNIKRDVKVDTGAAHGAITKIKKAIKDVHGKTVYIDVVMRESGPKRDQGERIPGVGLIPKWASGGAVLGPGLKGVDSKLAFLAPGEHVLTAAEVDAAGGHARVMDFRRSLLTKAHPPAGLSAEEGGAAARRSSIGPGGGIDAHTLRRALEGMTLVIDDRTGRTAQLIARGG